MRGHAKSVRPAPAGVLCRERLFVRLDAAATRARRIWIAGPPGAGKTTLATSWVTARGRPCLWLTLDPADLDPATFVAELARAARIAAPGARLPRFGPEYALGLAAYFRTLFRRLFDALPPGAVLVLDNVQVVPEGAPLLGLLREGLGELPPGLVALLASREPPPRPFERLRVEGALEVVEPGELLLDGDEVGAVARLRGVEDREEVAALARASEGWAAGLALLLASRERGAPRGAGGHPSPRTFDYLASEVLDRADADVRRVLLETSVLPWVDVQAAEARLGISGAARILDWLASRGYFTVRLEGEPVRYRFHPLFRALLERRARAELPPGRLAALRRDGAALLADAGADGEAVALLRDAREWVDLAALVGRRGPELLEAGRARDVAAWLDLLPAALVEGSPGLRFLRGMARLGAEPGAAAADLSAALDAFEAAGDGPGAFLAWSALVDTFVLSARFEPLDGCMERLARLEARYPDRLSADLAAKVGASVLPALMYRDARDPRLLAWLERNELLGASEPRARVMAATAMVIYDVNCSGRLARARRVLDEVAADARDTDPVASIVLASGDSIHRFVTGDLMRSHVIATDGLALAESSGARLWDFLLVAMQCWSAACAGRLDLAGEAEASLLATHDTSRSAHGFWMHCATALLAVARRDRRRAYEEARAARLCAEATECELMVALALPGEAACAAMGGAPPGEGPSLEEALDRARRYGCCWGEHLALVGLAGRERKAGGAALEARLRELFRTSRERGYLNPGHLFPEEIADLCAVALERGIEPETARTWVTTLHLSPPPRATGLEAWPWDLAVRVLGRLEVSRAGAPVAEAVAGRALDLLGALVALGGAGVDADHLATELWPDAEGDAARHALETALYRLRRLLGDPELVVQARGRLSLAPGRAWTDLWALEARLDVLERANGAGAGDGRPPLAAAVAGAYPGPLLPGLESPGIRERRARLDRRVQRALAGADAPR